MTSYSRLEDELGSSNGRTPWLYQTPMDILIKPMAHLISETNSVSPTLWFGFNIRTQRKQQTIRF